MNVVIEDDSKKNKKLKFIYICILLICIISIVIAVIIQLSGGNNTKQTGENKTSLPSLSDDQVSQHKNEFDNIFTNKVNYLENNSYKVSKIKQDQEIIYLGYNSKETKLNDYELNVNIPYININNEIIDDNRIQFLRDHILEMKKAVEEDGVDLLGYTVWGCIDPVSFTTGEMRKRYGFIYVDKNDDGSGTYARIKKKSFDWYKKVISSNGEEV